MYYGYSIVSGKEKSNYIKGGEYTGVISPTEFASNENSNFSVMRTHSERKRISEIDDMLNTVMEEYTELSKNIITASEAVKVYVKHRISELQQLLVLLENERRQLISAVS